VTTLVANPFLYNGSGISHPFMVLQVRSEISDAYNVTVDVTGVGPIQNRWHFDIVKAGSPIPVIWYLDSDTSLLDITEDAVANITVIITYYDGVGSPHDARWTLYPFTLLGRNSFDAYSHIAFFVTPDDIMIHTPDPAGIWQQFEHLKIVEDSDTIQFPLETLERGEGSRRDVALVLISAFEKAGIKTSIVESDHGYFVRYWERNKYRIIDPGKLGSSFSKADAEYPGYAVWDVKETWDFYNATVLSLS